MSPEHVGEIEDRRSARGAGVKNRPQRLDKTIHVARGNRPPTHPQQLITSVPPRMKNAWRYDGRLPGGYFELLGSDLDPERPGVYDDGFARIKMYVERRAARARRERAFED